MSQTRPFLTADRPRPGLVVRTVAAWVVVGALAVLAAACSSEPTAQAERQPAPTVVPAPAGVSADGSQRSLEVVDGGPITGLVLTDYRGFAVYGLTGETKDALLCLDDCIASWPPLSPRDMAGADNVDLTKLEFFTRPDGIDQVVYYGVPLYSWTGDNAVGITGGAGVAGTWFALTESGGFLDAG